VRKVAVELWFLGTPDSYTPSTNIFNVAKLQWKYTTVLGFIWAWSMDKIPYGFAFCGFPETLNACSAHRRWHW